jgi:hypothetical protein
MPGARKVCIDGKWKSYQPTDEFGCLGIRGICELEALSEGTQKRLLLRQKIWPQGPAPDINLSIRSLPEEIGLRKTVEKQYAETRDGSPTSQSQGPETFIQQDISGLVTLFDAVKRLLIANQPEKIWELYYNACAALDRMGAVGNRTEVPLQCPPSLAVGPGLTVVPLDAEVYPERVHQNSEACNKYVAWFGNEGACGFTAPKAASILHARALRRYLQQLLQMLQDVLDPIARANAAKLVAGLEKIPFQADLRESEDWIKTIAEEDWGIELPDDHERVELPPRMKSSERIRRPRFLSANRQLRREDLRRGTYPGRVLQARGTSD